MILALGLLFVTVHNAYAQGALRVEPWTRFLKVLLRPDQPWPQAPVWELLWIFGAFALLGACFWALHTNSYSLSPELIVRERRILRWHWRREFRPGTLVLLLVANEDEPHARSTVWHWELLVQDVDGRREAMLWDRKTERHVPYFAESDYLRHVALITEASGWPVKTITRRKPL